MVNRVSLVSSVAFDVRTSPGIAGLRLSPRLLLEETPCLSAEETPGPFGALLCCAHAQHTARQDNAAKLAIRVMNRRKASFAGGNS